jgi:hypothetical protein
MKRIMAVLLVIVLMLPLAVMAQEDPPTPLPEEDPFAEPVDSDPVVPEPVEAGITIGDITGDSEAYYGQTVTVEGNVDEFVNIRSFLLGESGLLTRAQLLVVNASGEELPLDVVKDSQVLITGVVYPHFGDGGWDMFIGDLPQRSDMTTPADSASQSNPQDVFNQFPVFVIQDHFPDHTLLVVYSIEDVFVTEIR